MGLIMTGFELRLWRRGLGWSQERAAEELGVSLRTYKTYEKKSPPRMAILATQALEMNFTRK
jgi:transcriptional regulator with XRE-family HTH domain